MTVGFKLYFPDPQTTFLHAFNLGSRFFTLFFPLRHQPQSCPQWQEEVGRACACMNVSVFHTSLGCPVPFESLIINIVRGVIDEVGRNCLTISNFSVWIKKLYHFEIPFCFLFFSSFKRINNSVTISAQGTTSWLFGHWALGSSYMFAFRVIFGATPMGFLIALCLPALHPTQVISVHMGQTSLHFLSLTYSLQLVLNTWKIWL